MEDQQYEEEVRRCETNVRIARAAYFQDSNEENHRKYDDALSDWYKAKKKLEQHQMNKYNSE